jgi:hypothetical protein
VDHLTSHTRTPSQWALTVYAIARHGHHNRRMTDAIQPEAPPLVAMVWPLVAALAVMAVWVVVVQLILTH